MSKNTISRTDFLKSMIRMIMGSLLILMALVLGRRISTGSDCSSCPGLGICRGEDDCNRFLAESK